MRYWLVAMALWAGQACAEDVVLELHQEALLRGPHMTLADLAQLDGPVELAGSVVGKAPLPGRVELRSRQELEALLLRLPQWRGKTVSWRGAQAVRVRAEAEAMSGERLAAEAVRYLHANFGERYARLEVMPASPVADVPVAPAGVTLKVRPLGMNALPGRVALWIDVLADGMVQRSVVVPLQVRAWREVLVARRHVPQGGAAGEVDFEAVLQRVDGLADEPAAQDGLLRGARLKRPLEAGQVVLKRDLAPAGAVLRGQRVRLLAGGPGVAIEVDAVAEADGLEGQAIAVRPVHGGGAVMARVTGPGEVRIEER